MKNIYSLLAWNTTSLLITILYLFTAFCLTRSELPTLFAEIEDLHKVEGHAQHTNMEGGNLRLHLVNDKTVYLIHSNFKKYWKAIRQAADNYRPIEIYHSGLHYGLIYPLEIRSDGKKLLSLEASRSVSKNYLLLLIAISLLYFWMMRKKILEIIQKRRNEKEERRKRTTILG